MKVAISRLMASGSAPTSAQESRAGDSVLSYFQGGGSSEIRPEVHRKFGCNVSKIPQKSATKEPPPRRGPSLPLSSLGL